MCISKTNTNLMQYSERKFLGVLVIVVGISIQGAVRCSLYNLVSFLGPVV